MHSLLKAAHPSSGGFRYTSNNLIHIMNKNQTVVALFTVGLIGGIVASIFLSAVAPIVFSLVFCILVLYILFTD